jgi:hypothetical protein
MNFVLSLCWALIALARAPLPPYFCGQTAPEFQGLSATVRRNNSEKIARVWASAYIAFYVVLAIEYRSRHALHAIDRALSPRFSGCWCWYL